MSREEQKSENLRDLFEKFVDSEQAEKAVEEIRKGEEMLSQYRCFGPEKGVIADIKGRIADAVRQREAINVGKRVLYRVSAAAVLILAAAAGVFFFGRGVVERESWVDSSILTEEMWESDDITTEDAGLAILFAELQQIEDEATGLRLNENGLNSSAGLEKLELELMEIKSDFWKG